MREMTRRRTGAMYFDYCSGLSLDEVAAKHGRTYGNVVTRFKQARLPLRSRRQPRRTAGRQANLNTAGLSESNQARAAHAGPEQAAAARAAIDLVDNPRYRYALQLRAEHPDLTLAEVAQLHEPPLTKHAYWARLRRGLEAAERIRNTTTTTGKETNE